MTKGRPQTIAQLPTRRRNRDEVRVDAIRMAKRKLSEGCDPCADRYLAVARENGATEAEIRDGLASSRRISRRGLIRAAAAAGAVLASASILGSAAEASTVWWGTDSLGQTCCGIPQNFYIGQFGFGTVQTTQYFNTGAAGGAGSLGTFEYWGLQGPLSAPAGLPRLSRRSQL